MFLQNFKIYEQLRKLMLPLHEIDEAIPKTGKVTELGCGQGVISEYLARRKSRDVTGIDLNPSRIGKKKKKNLKFKVGDIITFDYKPQDGFVISDVLHHIKYDDQKLVLAKLYRLLKKNGALVIKEINAEEFIRSKLSRFWDFVFYANDKIYYSASDDLKIYLEKLGFVVDVKRTNSFFPGSTTLFICKKHA